MTTTIQGPLHGLSAEALRLIKEVAGWKWHPGIYGFVNDFALAGQEQITRAELAQHHLFGSACEAERAAGIAWLTERLGTPVREFTSTRSAGSPCQAASGRAVPRAASWEESDRMRLATTSLVGAA